MSCNCSFTCKWIQRPCHHVLASILRGVCSIHVGIAKFKKARFMSTNFPPDQRFTIASSKGTRRIHVNVYKPSYLADLEARKESEQQGETNKYAVHINMHGSAWVFGRLFESDSEFCRAINRETGAIVLDCDYAKAPAHSFPAAYDDVCDIVNHVLSNAEGRYDTSRLTIGGFSTGATLALIVSATMRPKTFKAVTAFYPMTNLVSNPHSTSPSHQTPLSKHLKFGYGAYVPHSVSPDDPRLSPSNSPPSAFPDKILFILCEYDPLHDQSLEFANLIKNGGKDVQVVDVPGVGHGWDKTAEDGTDVGRKRVMAYDKTVEVLRAAYQY